MNSTKRKSCQLQQKKGIHYLSFVVVVCYITIAHAENSKELSQLAHDYILTHLDAQLKQPNIDMTPLSVVAGKPKCEAPIQIHFNGALRVGNVNLTLSCEKPRWQQYVSARITGLLPVVVSKIDLLPGQPITANDIELAWRANNQINNNHLRQLASLTNTSARQFIASGTAITTNQIKASILVHKNDQVNIIASDGSIHVEMAGVALDDGEMGKQIRVQNITSNKIIKAFVSGVDTVRVD